jgi:hypothetical protein
VVELPQFALDSAVAPGRVVSCHADDQCADRFHDAGSADTLVWVCPLCCDQLVVPAQDGVGRDDDPTASNSSASRDCRRAGSTACGSSSIANLVVSSSIRRQHQRFPSRSRKKRGERTAAQRYPRYHDDMRHIPLVVAALTLAAPSNCQRVLLVDATGKSGQFRTIMGAVRASTKDDLILVRKGTYVEQVLVDSRSVNILGIEPNVKDVVLRAPVSNVPALTVQNHPAGRMSRFSRLTIEGQGNYGSIETSSTKGDLLFEMVHTTHFCKFVKHAGIISLTACYMASRSRVVDAWSVDNLLCHHCRFVTSAVNSYLAVTTNVSIISSKAHLSHCSANGSAGGKYLIVAYPGGPALSLSSSTVTVSGIASDAFTGGNGVTVGTRTSAGGNGISVSSSHLTISGVTVTGGLGRFLGGPIQRSAPIGTIGKGKVTTAVPPTPTVSAQGVTPPLKLLSRGAKTNVVVHATPGALSLSFVAVDFSPFATPWGLSLIDLTKPAIQYRLTHGTSGNAAFAIDLQNLPATFVGAPYVIQSLVIDTNNRLSLSAPRLGVIGF